MRKKYELTDETLGNGALHRIKALVDIPCHNVKAGDLGGWIRSETNLSHKGNCWVADEACVFDNAHVIDDALVSGNAHILGYAFVAGNSVVTDHAYVIGRACVSGNSCISGKSFIMGKTVVNGDDNLSNVVINGDVIKQIGE